MEDKPEETTGEGIRSSEWAKHWIVMDADCSNQTQLLGLIDARGYEFYAKARTFLI